MELFASMSDRDIDSIDHYLDTPYSKKEKFKMDYQSPAQRKKAYLDYYVHNHPAASWTKIAEVLHRCGLPQQAAVVENTYIQGILWFINNNIVANLLIIRYNKIHITLWEL